MEHKFIRDESNVGAVINTDSSGLQAYKKRKQIAEEQRKEIETLKSDIGEIKHMLKQLLLKGN